MLPEPTLPKRRRGTPAPSQPWAMTPLFAVPDSAESASSESGSPEPGVIPSPGRRPISGGRAASRVNRGAGTGKAGAHEDPTDSLSVTAERLRRALGRSFLRYGIVGDLETAVHAAMNVIEPVLDARDTEILRLSQLTGAQLPGR